MFNVAGDDEAVAGEGVDLSGWRLEYDVAAEDVDHLFVGVGVPCADPSLLHAVADEHHVAGIGHDLATEAGLGGGHGGVLRWRDFDGHGSTPVLLKASRGLRGDRIPLLVSRNVLGLRLEGCDVA